MKSAIWSLFFFFAEIALAASGKVSCHFPNDQGLTTFEDCAQLQKSGKFKIEKGVLKQIKFDNNDLAGGSIGSEGCYWLAKSGLLRKAHCFDNSTDSFSEGLARFLDSKGLFGYMDPWLKVKIPAKYTFGFPFEDGFAKVCNDCVAVKSKASEHTIMTGGQWMVIDKKGRVVAECPGATDYNSCHLPAK